MGPCGRDNATLLAGKLHLLQMLLWGEGGVDEM